MNIYPRLGSSYKLPSRRSWKGGWGTGQGSGFRVLASGVEDFSETYFVFLGRCSSFRDFVEGLGF